MERIVTTEEMRSCDREAIEAYGIPGLVLMENAGRAVAQAISESLDGVRGKAFLVFSGKGNNGGDGFAAARHLVNMGADVEVACLAKPDELSDDARRNYEVLEQMSQHSTRLRLLPAYARKPLAFRVDVSGIVDAIFGTGFKGEMAGWARGWVEHINSEQLFVSQKPLIVSIDIPSGVDADTGRIEGPAVRADLTVTLGLKKRGLLMNEGRVLAGCVVVGDIGIPSTVYERLDSTFLLEAADVKLPRRPFNAHKHSVGKIFMLAGSRGFTGAAAMASMAAMRSGAGAVILGIPASLNPILEEKVTEVMTVPLAETNAGTLALKAADEAARYVEWADVLLIGPGLSRDEETVELIHRIVRKAARPVILDADGLNAFEGKADLLASHADVPFVITPHAGELSRLLTLPVGEIETQRIEVARDAASRLKSVVLLKGAPSVVGTPSGKVYANSTGNPGMATSGAGDVLSGLIAALLAQGAKTEEATFTGMMVHGAAGDRAASRKGMLGMIAGDVLEELPETLKDFGTLLRAAEARLARSKAVSRSFRSGELRGEQNG
ncbi:MAG: bifunctional ADP-dependent NAD(P)H-hydrate dehydratase/NAD(P)H-hydrate epimerase [Ignavibacteriales bacterium CG07_land_8_20_14_0_80_59_12]|nr:MAG: bifunctional ADP-dependent NAD(P)H-hydrate dehydratase/NAD(P)H-hydrate epimerase [Ignavibacteriales bacterium CG07_land_8_20_14_0_80_59_12]